MPYAPLPGGGGILPAVSNCRPVLLGGVDLSMSAAAVPASSVNSMQLPSIPLPTQPSIVSHLEPGPVMMSRPAPSIIGTGPPSVEADGPPNPDVLLALLARNKKLEG